jgi:polysaccharide pyruvyl transferase WcaK-like protein
MKIFIEAFAKTPTVSVGTQAYIIAAMELLEKTFPACEFFIFSFNREMDQWLFRNEKLNVTIVDRPESGLKAMFTLYKIARQTDVIVSLWGDGYISAPARNILRKTLFFRLAGARSVLWPSSIGIEKSTLLKKLQRAGLSGFEVLLARDTITYEHFQTLKLSPISLVADMAFILDPPNKKRIAELYKLEGIPADKKCVGLNISQLMNQYFKKEGKDYPKFAAELALYLRELSGCNVLLIPHQFYPSWFKPRIADAITSLDGDDRVPVKEVLKVLDGAEGIYPIMGEYDSREFKGIISSCELMVGARMHSIIAALSTSVPSVIMSYSHKATGLFKMLGLEKYAVDFRGDIKKIKSVIHDAWENREALRCDLDAKMPDYKAGASRLGESLKLMLK